MARGCRRVATPEYSTARLPHIEGKISRPHRAGQYLRRALSAYLPDFGQYRSRVGFRLWLTAGCGNVVEPGPESVNPDCAFRSNRLGRLPVRATHAPYSHHLD